LPKSKPHDVELIAGLEHRLLQVWPAVTTQMIDGWALRFAGGYTGRANSASAITAGARMTDALLARIIEMYEAETLVPQMRISPVAHAGTAEFLKQRGFVSRGLAHTMTANIEGKLQTDTQVVLGASPDMNWCIGVTSRQVRAKRNPDALYAIVSRIQCPAKFATVVVDGKAIGFGVAAIDRGWVELGSIVIDAAFRGKGLGRALVVSLLQWAKTQDVHRAFLQVDVTNTTALVLYQSLGFEILYDYDTVALK
jgi:N-acetylglutamate synthase